MTLEAAEHVTDEVESLTGYLFDVARGEEESIAYPGTQLDTLKFGSRADGVFLYRDPDPEPPALQPDPDSTADQPGGETLVEVSAHENRVSVLVRDLNGRRVERTIYPAGHEPEAAFPHQIATKPIFIDWIGHMLQHPADLGTETDTSLLHAAESVDSLPRYAAHLLETEVITSDCRVALSIDTLVNRLELTPEIVENGITFTGESIVPVFVDPTVEDDAGVVPEQEPDRHFGHVTVFDAEETVSSNVKSFTTLDREMVAALDELVVDVDDIMQGLLAWLYEVPMGVDRHAFITVTPPADARQVATYGEFSKREAPKNGEITINPAAFIDASDTEYQMRTVSEALIGAGSLDHPEDHEVYQAYIDGAVFVDEIELHEDSKYELTASVEYTGVDETEYYLPGVPET